jgi:hypothetical protein
MADRLKQNNDKKQNSKKLAKYSSYQDWYKSTEARKFVLDNIAKSGLPLEFKTRKILLDHGFHVSSARYFEPSDVEPASDLSP